MTEYTENKTTADGISDTLYLPLLGRIYTSKNFPDYFYDEEALKLESVIPKHILNSNLLSEKRQYFHLASATRYVLIDAEIRRFIVRYPHCNIVNLGAGLETMTQRIGGQHGDSCSAHFYQLDLPEIIEMRKQLLPEEPNETCISGSFLDVVWANEIDTSLPTLLVASGLFHYFTIPAIQKFLRDIFACISDIAVVFDANNRLGVKISNYFVRKSGNKGAPMFFYVNDGKVFFKEILPAGANAKEYLFFDQARKELAGKACLSTIVQMWVCDIVMQGAKIITGGTIYYD